MEKHGNSESLKGNQNARKNPADIKPANIHFHAMPPWKSNIIKIATENNMKYIQFLIALIDTLHENYAAYQAAAGEKNLISWIKDTLDNATKH